MTLNNLKMIERLNSVIVTPEELSAVLDEADKLRDAGKDEDGGGIYLITRMFRKQPERAQANIFVWQPYPRL